MWNKLSMADRAKYIQLGVQSGVTNLDTIKKHYNTYAEGGYLDWIQQVKSWRPGIEEDIDAEEPTYDYEGFFHDNPEYAWSMLNGDPEAHFIDKYKKPNHPTFSDESIYSTPETPGGHWHENYGGSGRWVYEPSEFTKKNKEATRRYLENSGEGYLNGMNVEFYNRYDDGGFMGAIKSFFGFGDDAPKVEPRKEAPSRFRRVHQNDSPTSERSSNLENTMARTQQALLRQAESKRAPSSEGYFIPYTGEELRIPGVGRVSSNTLDSIAVNAERANIPLGDALGLASVETKMGAAPNTSTDSFKKKYKRQHGKDPSKEEVKAFERGAMNASYMRNFGGIYPQYLVNNHEWSNRGWEQSPKYKEKLQGITSPLEHAFTQFKLGIYNPGDKNHTSNVKAEGARLMGLPVVQQWQKGYNQRKKSKKRK
jgi:hypothetical protein